MEQTNHGLVHLEELAKHYPVMLPDTSVINETFGMSSDLPDMKERKKVLVERVDLSNTFTRRIDSFPNILFTPGILKEIGNFNSGTAHGERIFEDDNMGRKFLLYCMQVESFSDPGIG